jgi:uncharacterized RmlC-like cupin family protein
LKKKWCQADRPIHWAAYVPPFVPHQEINASEEEVLECVLARSDGESVVVNLDIEPVEKPESVKGIDPIHRS